MSDAAFDQFGAAGVTWDLEGLMPGGAPAASAAGRKALALAGVFERAHRSRVAGYDVAALGSALDEFERLHGIVAAAYGFAEFRNDADSEDPANGALLSELEEVSARVDALVTFFELEWIEVGDERATELPADPALERFAHLLRVQRSFKPHRLTEPEERMLTKKSLTGVEAWRRLLDEQLSALEVALDGESIGLPEAIDRLSSAERAERRRAAAAVTAALAPGLRTRAHTFNVILADHALDDRLRQYSHWLAALTSSARRRMSQCAPSSTRSCTATTSRNAGRLKAQALGLARLADYDRYASVAGPEPRVGWDRARELVVSSYGGFSDELGRQADRFFAERWIDAETRPGKTPGAYCAPTVPEGHPFVLVNFGGRLDDVLTLAHEIGHGLHFLLAAPRGLLQTQAPMTLSETASVFGETLAFAHLMTLDEDPVGRFRLLARQLDDAIETVFRQVAIHRFEDAVHRERRARGELSVERIGELWISANDEMSGPSVELTDGYRSWWSYISHVFSSPGYVYAYAYGQLMALSIYRRYLEQGESFVPRYLELLTAGGSRSLEQLAHIVGIDLGDQGFWDTGLGLIDQRLAEAEAAAREVGS